jgi:hypothetical protein
MPKFYVKIYIPATQLFVKYQDFETWDETMEIYRWLESSGLIALAGQNEGAN